MRAAIILSDFAQVSDGKLTVVGAGWDFIGPDPCPFAVGVLLQVPWDQTNKKHSFSLILHDGDGKPYVGPQGEKVAVEGQMEVGRPPGYPVGSSMTSALALNVGPVPLRPGNRYEVILTINGASREEWKLAFNTRSGGGPQRLAG